MLTAPRTEKKTLRNRIETGGNFHSNFERERKARERGRRGRRRPSTTEENGHHKKSKTKKFKKKIEDNLQPL